MTTQQLTFDQATKELEFNDREIALAIHDQAESASSQETADAAQALIENYRKGIENYRKGVRNSGEEPNAAEAARTEFLGRYDAWRFQFGEIVAPIAVALNHPMPGMNGQLPSTNAAAQTGDIFAQDKPPAAQPPKIGEPPKVRKHPVDAEVTRPQTTDAEITPPKFETIALEGSAVVVDRKATRKVRRAWSQPDVVMLTKLYSQPNVNPKAAAQAFVTHQRDDLTVEEVFGKAVELGLCEAPPAPKTIELSDSDKTLLTKRVRTLLSTGEIKPDQRLLELKHCAAALREFIKELAG